MNNDAKCKVSFGTCLDIKHPRKVLSFQSIHWAVAHFEPMCIHLGQLHKLECHHLYIGSCTVTCPASMQFGHQSQNDVPTSMPSSKYDITIIRIDCMCHCERTLTLSNTEWIIHSNKTSKQFKPQLSIYSHPTAMLEMMLLHQIFSSKIFFELKEVKNIGRQKLQAVS